MNSTEAFDVVAKALSSGAKSVKGMLNVQEMKKLMAKVFNADPEDLVAFAFRVGRNAVIDRNRRKEAAARMQVLADQAAAQALQDAREQWDRAQDLREAREQFVTFIAGVPNGPQTQTRSQQLEIVRLQVLEGLDGDDLAMAFPGSTQEQRWQWKRRGVKLLLKHKPPEPLARVIRDSIHNL